MDSLVIFWCLTVVVSIICLSNCVIYIISGLQCSIELLHNFFQVTTISFFLCRTICSWFISIYFTLLMVKLYYPFAADDLYYSHINNIFFILIYIFYYLSSCFEFFLYNARLFYSFREVKYRVKSSLFHGLNTFIISFTFVCCILVFLNLINSDFNFVPVICLIFNIFSLIFIILSIWLTYIFTQRMFMSISDQAELIEISSFEVTKYISKKQQQKLVLNKKYLKSSSLDRDRRDRQKQRTSDRRGKYQAIQSHAKSSTSHVLDVQDGRDLDVSTCASEYEVNELNRLKDNNIDYSDLQEINNYLNVIIKSNLLLTNAMLAKCCAIFGSVLYNYLRLNNNSKYIFLCILSIDCLIGCSSVLLLYRFSEYYYMLICGWYKAPNKSGIERNRDTIDIDLAVMNLNKHDEYSGCHRIFERCCIYMGTKYHKQLLKRKKQVVVSMVPFVPVGLAGPPNN